MGKIVGVHCPTQLLGRVTHLVCTIVTGRGVGLNTGTGKCVGTADVTEETAKRALLNIVWYARESVVHTLAELAVGCWRKIGGGGPICIHGRTCSGSGV